MFHPPTGQVLIFKRSTNATPRDIFGVIEHAKESGYRGPLWICERGISAFGTDDISRWRLDLQIIPQIKETHPEVKVMVDLTHGVGRREWVLPMAKAAKGAGADGLLVECLDVPDDSPSDARQTIDLPTMAKIMEAVK